MVSKAKNIECIVIDNKIEACDRLNGVGFLMFLAFVFSFGILLKVVVLKTIFANCAYEKVKHPAMEGLKVWQ